MYFSVQSPLAKMTWSHQRKLQSLYLWWIFQVSSHHNRSFRMQSMIFWDSALHIITLKGFEQLIKNHTTVLIKKRLNCLHLSLISDSPRAWGHNDLYYSSQDSIVLETAEIQNKQMIPVHRLAGLSAGGAGECGRLGLCRQRSCLNEDRWIKSRKHLCPRWKLA